MAVESHLPLLPRALSLLRAYLAQRHQGPPTFVPEPGALTQNSIGFGEQDIIEWGFSENPSREGALQADGFIVYVEAEDTADPVRRQFLVSIESRSHSVSWPLGSVRSYAIAAYRITHQGMKIGPKMQHPTWRGAMLTEAEIRFDINGLGRGRLIVGGTIDPTDTIIAGGVMQLLVESEGSGAGTPFGAYYAGDNDQAAFFGIRSRGTLAAPTESQDGDTLYALLAIGFDSDDTIAVSPPAVQLLLFQDGAAGSGFVPGGLRLLIVDASGSGAERFTIRENGFVGLTESDPESRLHIDGAITLEPQASNPDDPSTGDVVRQYVKGSLFVLQYNDGGTVRYKYLDMAGTGTTWTHTTTPP